MGDCRRWRMASDRAHFPTAVDAVLGVMSDGRQSPVAHVLSARARVADLTPRSRHAPCRVDMQACPSMSKLVPVAPVLIIHSLAFGGALSPAILPVVFIRHSLDSFDAAE